MFAELICISDDCYSNDKYGDCQLHFFGKRCIDFSKIGVIVLFQPNESEFQH